MLPVWPEVNAEVHPGRLVLFVADRTCPTAKQKPWPLLKAVFGAPLGLWGRCGSSKIALGRADWNTRVTMIV